MGINQVLVSGRGVAPQAQLAFDEGAVELTQGGGRRSGRQQLCRRPGLSSLGGSQGPSSNNAAKTGNFSGIERFWMMHFAHA